MYPKETEKKLKKMHISTLFWETERARSEVKQERHEAVEAKENAERDIIAAKAGADKS